MSSKRVHIVSEGFTPDPVSSDRSIEWLEKNYREADSFGRIECPCCGARNLTVLDIKCMNCGVFIAKNRQPIDKDGAARLAGGITAQEAMRRAERWWNKTARHYFKRMRSRKGDPVSRTRSLQPYGIFMGRKFCDLSRGEKFRVVKAWHQSWYQVNAAEMPNLESTDEES